MIVTSTGKTYEVKPPYTVSDEGITLYASGKSTKIPKSEIACPAPDCLGASRVPCAIVKAPTRVQKKSSTK